MTQYHNANVLSQFIVDAHQHLQRCVYFEGILEGVLDLVVIVQFAQMSEKLAVPLEVNPRIALGTIDPRFQL